MKKRFALAVAVAVLVALPYSASAWNGNLLDCNGTVSNTKVPADPVVVAVKPGFTCAEQKIGLKVAATVDSCDATAPGALWDTWGTWKFEKKMTQALAASIVKADVQVKGTTFATCNFAGTALSRTASGTLKFKLRNAAGDSVAKGQATVIIAGAGHIGTVTSIGVVTKGFGIGATAQAAIALDVAPAGPNGGAAGLLVCQPSIVPPSGACASSTYRDALVAAPLETITLAATGGGGGFLSAFRIDDRANADCLSGPPLALPFDCCTGFGTGACEGFTATPAG